MRKASILIIAAATGAGTWALVPAAAPTPASEQRAATLMPIVQAPQDPQARMLAFQAGAVSYSMLWMAARR